MTVDQQMWVLVLKRMQHLLAYHIVSCQQDSEKLNCCEVVMRLLEGETITTSAIKLWLSGCQDAVTASMVDCAAAHEPVRH